MINIGPESKPISGSIVYIKEDHSFTFENQQTGLNSGSMLVLSTLVIEIDGKDGRLQYPEGYLSMGGWRPRSLSMPDLLDRSLYSDIIPMTGAAYPVEEFAAGVGNFFPEYDANKNLLRLARKRVRPSKTAVRFCDGAAMGFEGDVVTDLWIIEPLFRDSL
ncbi:hypothetical protein [Rathayibacter rathayi]|uniref:hypothetical protein n=1 Tax=Rathayibacter rathayi TaxID=33887 RepID=UPI0011AFDB13|nr:hypothetical protein [Rathayibacter rathayi]